MQRHGSGNPFILHSFNNINSAKLKLYDIIGLEEERGRPYFVDNDFFNNKYKDVKDLYYLQIVVRDISEWKAYSEEKEIKKENNKIIFIQNFKNNLTK